MQKPYPFTRFRSQIAHRLPDLDQQAASAEQIPDSRL
jgi:hypothetical protein